MTLQISADACYRLIGRYTMNSTALGSPFVRSPLFLSLSLFLLFRFKVIIIIIRNASIEDLFRFNYRDEYIYIYVYVFFIFWAKLVIYASHFKNLNFLSIFFSTF